MIQTDYGPGPWYVALICEQSLQLSDIVEHTYPDLLVAAMNTANRGLTQWEIHMCVGNFDSLHECRSYGKLWGKSKQLKTRVENGYRLFNNTRGKYRMWIKELTHSIATPHPIFVDHDQCPCVADLVDIHRQRVIK